MPILVLVKSIDEIYPLGDRAPVKIKEKINNACFLARIGIGKISGIFSLVCFSKRVRLDPFIGSEISVRLRKTTPLPKGTWTLGFDGSWSEEP